MVGKCRTVAVLSIILLLLFATGCVEQRYTINIQNDTIELRVEMTASRGVLTALSEYNALSDEVRGNPALLFSEVKKVYVQRGFFVSEITNENRFGYTFRKQYATAEEVTEDLDHLFSANASGLSGVLERRDGNHYVFDGELSYVFTNAVKQLMLEIPDYTDYIDFDGMNASLNMRFPHLITAKENGIQTSEEEIMWNLHYSEDSNPSEGEGKSVVVRAAAMPLKKTHTETIIAVVITFGVVGIIMYASKKNILSSIKNRPKKHDDDEPLMDA